MSWTPSSVRVGTMTENIDHHGKDAVVLRLH